MPPRREKVFLLTVALALAGRRGRASSEVIWCTRGCLPTLREDVFLPTVALALAGRSALLFRCGSASSKVGMCTVD